MAVSAMAGNPALKDAYAQLRTRMEKAVTDFLSAPGTDKMAAGKMIFAGLFDTMNAQRSSVMSGLERVTRKQREAADKIRSDTIALQALQDATPPDQAKVDELGNVWVTGPRGLWVISPEGEHLGIVEVPENVGNLAWGGPDWKTLYIPSSTSLYRLPTKVASVALPYH